MILTPDQLLAIRAAARRAVFRYFLQPQPSDVDDLAQEVAAKALAHLTDFDPSKGEWSAWVNTIAARSAIDQGLKKRSVSLPANFEKAADTSEVDEAVERDTQDVRRLLPRAPLRTRAVLAAQHPDQFPPCAQVRMSFSKLFQISWEASRGLEEWTSPTPEFLAARAGLPKNTLIDQPLRRLRLALVKEVPALARLLRNPRRGASQCSFRCS